ncbi:MAG TPA: DUF4446 domain-containing protein [Peptococcaceae bacterium]|nr:MAG: Uncharacterized protein XD50_0360 [Clostridia bacterium 41_269]HBT19808.1 DUF4446 domain-containing protein [Peptococcaceae bacterium]
MNYSFILDLLKENLVYAVIVLFVLAVMFLLLLMIQGLKIKDLRRQLKKLQSVEIPDFPEDLKDFKLELERLEKMIETSLRRVGVERYNAFDDVGSDLSFSVAILDDHGTGVVITSLYGRNESRTYAKPIVKGSSQYKLSSEEVAAIRKAMEK